MHPLATSTSAAPPGPRVVIIGAGMAGICLAIRLKQSGCTAVRIFEKSDDVGGTWLHNTYPGAACDIPSFLYCYSFAPKYDWTHLFAPQSEILDYVRDCADRFDVRRHVEFGTAVIEAVYDDARAAWTVRTDRGETIEADVVVSAVGQLQRPAIPALPGLDDFQGPMFHSARWNHDCSLVGRAVAVIGNAASAVQLIPPVAEQARRTYVFQRTPNWISPLNNRRYSRVARWMFAHVPGRARVHRARLYLEHELRFAFLRRRGFVNRCLAFQLRHRMRSRIAEPLRGRLIPEYEAGCKRVLLSDRYLQALHRDDVELVTDPITRITADSIVTAGGERRVDAIVLATGFEAGRFLSPIAVRGRDGRRLEDAWPGRPRTYLGLMTPGFPNFFMLYGPNTNLGHNSIVMMIECQVHYLLGCVRAMRRRGVQAIDVRHDVVERFDRGQQAALDKTAWNGGCTNWYKTSGGAIVNNWHATVAAYWLRTRRPRLGDFELIRRPAVPPADSASGR